MVNENTAQNSYRDYKSEITDIVRSNLTPKLLKEKLLEYHSNDIAMALEELNEKERLRLYSILGLNASAEILEYSDSSALYIGELSLKKRAYLLSHIEPSVAVAYLESIDEEERDAIVELFGSDTKNEIELLTSFDKDEIGSKMTTNYISIVNGTDVRGAMHELIAQAAENDNVSTIYVVDSDDTFMGAIDLKDLIIARTDTPLDSVMMTTYPYVYVNDPIDECVERIKGYSEDSIPVLDPDNKLRGVLTAQELAQLIEDEIGDDYAKLAGLSSEEDLHEPLFKSIGKRLPWLLILFGMGLLVSSAVGVFERVVASLTVIVSFQSLILGMAGNVGTQSLAVTIRLLMDEGLDTKQKLSLIFKEARVGFCNGMLIGIISFITVGAYLFLLKGESATLAFSVSACIGIAMLISMLLSSISGTSIPMLLKKMKIDPAVASGPFITTLNDLVAVVTYYGLAWLLLINVLGL